MSHLSPEVSMIDFMDSFTDQPGYPLIEVSYETSGILTANQSRFFYLRKLFYSAEKWNFYRKFFIFGWVENS